MKPVVEARGLVFVLCNPVDVDSRFCTLGSSRLVLQEARHPCLALQDGISFIPNDVEMIKGIVF